MIEFLGGITLASLVRAHRPELSALALLILQGLMETPHDPSGKRNPHRADLW